MTFIKNIKQARKNRKEEQNLRRIILIDALAEHRNWIINTKDIEDPDVQKALKLIDNDIHNTWKELV